MKLLGSSLLLSCCETGHPGWLMPPPLSPFLRTTVPKFKDFTPEFYPGIETIVVRQFYLFAASEGDKGVTSKTLSSGREAQPLFIYTLWLIAC